MNLSSTWEAVVGTGVVVVLVSVSWNLHREVKSTVDELARRPDDVEQSTERER